MTSGKGMGLSSFLSALAVSLCTPRPLQGYPTPKAPGTPPSSPLHLQGSRDCSHSLGFMQDAVTDADLTHFYLAPFWFLLPPSPQLPSCVPHTAAYSEDLTGASAIHSFHINPLCREEFCPNQVMNSNEPCHSSAIQQMTSLPSVLAALPWWQIPQMRDMNHTKSRSGHGVWVQKDDFSSVLSRHAWPHSAWAHSEGPPPGLVTINEHMQSSEPMASFSTASSTGYVKY